MRVAIRTYITITSYRSDDKQKKEKRKEKEEKKMRICRYKIKRVADKLLSGPRPRDWLLGRSVQCSVEIMYLYRI